MTTSNDIATEALTIKRTFNLPVDKVWQAWTEPESCKKWWGPEGYTCPSCTIDLREGGKYLNCMKGPDGIEMWSTGIYEEIIPQRKLVYTDSFSDSDGNVVPGSYYKMPEMPMELEVTVLLEEVDGKTNMLLKHAGIPESMKNDCIKGWQSCFDKLEHNMK